MKKEKYNRTAINFFEWLIACFIVLNFRTVYTSWNRTATVVSLGTTAGIVLSGIAIFLVSKRRLLSRSNIFSVINMLIYLVAFLIIQESNRDKFLVIAIIIITFTILRVVCFEDVCMNILKKYAYIVVIVAVVSSVFWILASILKLIPSTNQIMIGWSNGKSITNYMYLYFETQQIPIKYFYHGVITRNSAIFVEAPMAAINFSLAFGILSLLDDGKNKKELIILGIAILTTVSTTGYIYILGIIMMKYILNQKNRFSKSLKYMAIPVVAILVGYVTYILLIEKYNTKSGSLRINDFMLLKETWNIHPYIGSGIGNVDVITSAMEFWRISQNLTGFANSITMIWINGGLYLSAIYIFSLIRGILDGVKYNKEYMTFVLGLIYLLVTTVAPYRFAILLCIVILLIRRGKC